MTALSEDQVREHLATLSTEASERLSSVLIDASSVGIILDADGLDRAAAAALRAQIEEHLAKQTSQTVNVIISAPRAAPAPQPKGPPRGPGATPPPPKPTPLPGVRHVIAVASGKGGVGKSTTSVNLALSLAAEGLSVGLMDADIFGPSLPTLMGCADAKPEAVDKVLQPIMAHGLKLMSIGFLLDVDQPVVWRGPRVMGATQQLLRDVAWGPLDVLVVDMPPGTGDVQLTMVQQAPLTGAVIVSTPQDLALIDARKGLAMFQKVEVPILGIVENMSQFICPNCGTASAIFGTGGARETAESLSVPFLGAVPLEMGVRECSDAGTPFVLTHKDSATATIYRTIAAQLVPHLARP